MSTRKGAGADPKRDCGVLRMWEAVSIHGWKAGREETMNSREPITGTSKVLGLLVAILTVLSIVGGLIWNLSRQITTLQVVQVMQTQQIHSNSEGVKTLNDKRESDEDNFTKLIMMMARMSSREGR